VGEEHTFIVLVWNIRSVYPF